MSLCNLPILLNSKLEEAVMDAAHEWDGQTCKAYRIFGTKCLTKYSPGR